MTLKERFEALPTYEPEGLEEEPYFSAADAIALAEKLDAEAKDAAAFGLACLSPEARVEAMAAWCHHCGDPNPCNCMRDD